MCFVRFILAEKILSLYAVLGSKQHSDGNPSHTKHHTNEDAATHCHSHLESNERKTSGTNIQKKYARRMQTMPSQAFLCG